jgi:hypothetical protein
MKIKIPDELKADVPQNIWGKILSATPVIMTVVATMLAGLASSEMTRAQYGRALAAQQQSKAGDQWGFFQAKRLRGSLQRSTLDILQASSELRPFQPDGASPGLLAALRTGELPATPASTPLEPNVKNLLTAIEHGSPEPEIATLLSKVTDKTLISAVHNARDDADKFDAALQPVNKAIENLEASISSFDLPARRDFTAARVRYTAQRYDAEARLNQTIANLYELQVRKSNSDAERHHRRSQKFFFGMLAAQAAVIIATFAIAAKKRNLLWSLAAAAGVAAIGFAIYVYLYV